MGANRRTKERALLEPIEISSFMTLDHMTLISRTGHIIDASSTGLLIQLTHKDLIPKILRETLTLEAIEGDRVMFTIPKMNLELSGKVARTKLVGKKVYEIAVDFSGEAPEFWRECLYELLPRPGEFD